MMRILVAGFQHETNTFAPTKAAYEDFVNGGGYPALARGRGLFALKDLNIPAGGFIKHAEQNGHTVVPAIWAAASPAAHVRQDAYDRIAGAIFDTARREEFDAVYLDLHGAMVTEKLDDGEGAILATLREIVGPAVPIVASLDLHANVTPQMLSMADGLVADCTYPHIDMADTGRRALSLLEKIALDLQGVYCATRRLPFLIPINAMCTTNEPARSAYARNLASETRSILSLSYAPGFPASDFPFCGPVIWGYGSNQTEIEHTVETLYRQLVDAHEDEWRVPFLSPDEAVREAIALSLSSHGPVVIADTQDNPGAGGDADTTGMLRALLQADVKDAAIGMMWDPSAVAAAHDAGVG